MKQSTFKKLEYRRLIFMIRIAFVVSLVAMIRIGGSAFSGSGARILAPQTTVQKAQKTDTRELKMGPGIERELAGGDAHSYRVVLAKGQYMKAVIEQRGIDVVVRAYGPDGQKIEEVDSPNGAQGPEPVSIIAETGGEYRLEVLAFEKGVAPGRYEIKIAALREATTQDRARLAAERTYAQGYQLHVQGLAESRRQGIEKFEEALAVWRAVGDREREAATLSMIGLVYLSLGESQRALESHSRALPLWRALEDRYQEATTLHEIGVAYNSLGEPQKALEYYRQALQVHRGYPQDEATTLMAMGLAYWGMGEPQKALEHYTLALPALHSAGDHRSEGVTLNNIGDLYRSLGEPQRALEYHGQALLLLRAIGDHGWEANTLRDIGLTYSELGESQKALEYQSQALVLFRTVGNRRGEANTLRDIGLVYSELGESQKALEHYNQALPLTRAIGDRLAEALTLDHIGTVYLSLGEPQKALESFNRALSYHRAVGNRINEAITLRGIARVELNLGHLEEARTQMKTALNLIESTRSQFVSQQLRTSFAASRQDFYEFYIDLEMRMHRGQPSAGYDAAALQTSERARARSLLEILTESRADIRQGIDPVLLEHEHSLQQQLNAKSERLSRLLGDKHTDEQATAARKEVEALLEEYQEVEAEIRAKSPRYAALTQPQPLSLKEIQQLLDKETLLLEYALGEERSYLWAVTPTSIKSFELPKRAEIETAARRVYDLLVTKADTLYPEALTSLSQTLLGPVADQLGRKRLLIVGQGALQYVPFGALPEPSAPGARTRDRGSGISKHISFQSLVVNHEIVSLPSASVMALLRRELSKRTAAPNKVVVLADPVFGKDDQRVKSGIESPQVKERNGEEKDNGRSSLPSDVERSASDLNLTSFDRLPISRNEADIITAMVPKAESLKALDFAASRATATSPALGQYQIVHFATHSLLNNQHPELSGIVLSLVDEQGQPQDGFLRLHDIYNLKLEADLVVLSACQTALGKEIKGEGLVGLTRGFMYAGTPRVVASLWKVSDKATAELMKRFYQKMLREGLRPAAALRAAQVSMLQEKQWAVPYYWAGFVLQGEWR